MLVTGVYLLVGLAMFGAYLATQNAAWVEDFFHIPGAILFVGMAALQLGFAIAVWKQFNPGEPMRLAWSFIVCAAACELFGSLATQVFAADTVLNLLRDSSVWSESTALAIRHAGLAVGSTCRFALLAAGLYCALRVYRRTGFLARLMLIDRMLLGVLGLYVVWEAADLLTAIQHGKQPGWAE